ncbi:MAG: oligopeptide transport system ATP-binding protein [bacterium]|jgi:oligopeptide transport system ATP-binding protein
MNKKRVPILDVQNVSKFFPVKKGIFQRTKQYIKAVQKVSLQIFPNETLGLVGESGSGKSTLGRVIMQLLSASEGKVYFLDHELTKLSFSQMANFRQKMQMIFQDPMDSLNARFNIEQIIEEPLLINKVGTSEERKKRVSELMILVGLNPEWVTRYPHEFSGGQRQRIGIARALALSPQLIIADEPVSALDVSIQAQILNLMLDLQNELGVSFLFISHDLHVIRHICDRVAVMYLGQIVELTDSQKIYENPAHPYTKALIESIPNPDPRKKQDFQAIQGEIPSPINPPSGCHFHPRCPKAADKCKKDEPQLELITETHQVACFFPNEN